MRLLLRLLCVCALGLMPLVGCGEGGSKTCDSGADCDDGSVCTLDRCNGRCTYVPIDCNDENECTEDLCDPTDGCSPRPVGDGAPCTGGVCEAGVCALMSSVVPCTEQGLRNAIAAGGGPYTFACDAPTTFAASFGIQTDVILDAEGQLTVDGFGVSEGVTAEVHGFEMRPQDYPGAVYDGHISIWNSGTLLISKSSIVGFNSGILNSRTLTLRESTVSGNQGGGILNGATLTAIDSRIVENGTGGFGPAAEDGAGVHNVGVVTLTNCTVSENHADGSGGGIYSTGTVTLTNTTLSGNTARNGAAVFNTGVLVLTQTTVAENTAFEGYAIHNDGVATATNTIIEGDCGGMTALASGNHNIESRADTCGLPGKDDQVRVTAEQLNLGELADNGGPTLTHKPGDGGFGTDSVAIDRIPEADCEVDADQRGEPRPETGGTMCDVGAVEVQP